MRFKQDPIYKPQVLCPSCGKSSNIDYCSINSKYTWWCSNDNCGKQYSFIINKDWSVESEPTGTIVTSTIVTLELPLQKSSIFLKVKGKMFNGEHNDEYFYNEHTCPINILHSAEDIIIEGCDDRHGVFRYIKTEILNSDS